MSIAKQDFESQLIRDLAVNNSSKIYKYISSLSRSHQLPPIMHFDDTQASSSFDQAHLFNQFFQSVFSYSLHDLPSSTSLPVSSMYDINILLLLLMCSRHCTFWPKLGFWNWLYLSHISEVLCQTSDSPYSSSANPKSLIPIFKPGTCQLQADVHLVS